MRSLVFRRHSVLVCSLFFLPLSTTRGFAQTATVAEARTFLAGVNTKLLALQTASAHGEWAAETYINEDTEATTALLNSQNEAETLRMVAESHRFDKVELPAELRRQMTLLQVNAPAAPKDPSCSKSRRRWRRS